VGPDRAFPKLRHRQPKTLFGRVRSRPNLYSAWRSVRRRALRPGSSYESRLEAELFEIDAPSRLEAIARDLRKGKFAFAPQRGVLKRRPGKKPRPIVSANILNRIVQRAILNVLQSHDAIRPSIRSEQSFGGIPGRGCKEAIAEIAQVLDSGAGFYCRSDIQDFFTKIPRQDIVDDLRPALADDNFCNLLLESTHTTLSNEEDLVGFMDLFPLDRVGVPQGSALSALLGNVLLHPIDIAVEDVGVRLIRYIDDLVIIGKSEQVVSRAFGILRQKLKKIGMNVYDPGHSKKAAKGPTSRGFDFLGVSIRPGMVYPSRASRENLRSAMSRLAKDGKSAIGAAGRGDVQGREQALAQCLNRMDGQVAGWCHSFSFCTVPHVIRDLDAQLDRIIFELVDFYVRQSPRAVSREARRRMLGIRPAADTPVGSWGGEGGLVALGAKRRTKEAGETAHRNRHRR
jgi:RNA-directed DNA polymerase